MDCGDALLNPLKRDGTSQNMRLLEALDPSFVSVDERTLADLLLYAQRYARLLRYYGPENEVRGDWVEFIEHDITALASLVSTTDTDAKRAAFEKLRADATSAAGAATRQEAYGGLLDMSLDVATQIDDWYARATKDLGLWRSIRRLIGSALGDAVRDLYAQLGRASAVGVSVKRIGSERFNEVWGLATPPAPAALFLAGGPTDEAELTAAVERATDVFAVFHESLASLVEDAPRFLDETLERYPRHQPHMALFLAFLGLLKHAQSHLNTLTGKHLDFYFREVLQLEDGPAQADEVHLIFELAKNFKVHAASDDTGLKAGKDATGAELLYAMDDELAVNQAVLHTEHGLKSVFVDRDEHCVVDNVYAAPMARSADGLGADIEDPDGTWAPFGSSDMPHARLGFAVSSPLFRLQEGTRTVALWWRLRSTDFFANRSKEDVAYELHHNVIVAASGEKEWVDVDVVNVHVSDGKDVSFSKNEDPILHPLVADDFDQPFVAFELRIGSGQPAVLDYDADVLTGGFDAKYPVLRFLLDPEGLPAPVAREADVEPEQEGTRRRLPDVRTFDATVEGYDKGALVSFEGRPYQKMSIPHAERSEADLRPPNHPELWAPFEYASPYRYFERMEIQALDIRLHVRGMRNLILESDVGILDPAKPFLPFGPVPKQGSSFFVGSWEVFQKEFTHLSLAVEWANLPDVNFAEHYDLYRRPLTKEEAAAKKKAAKKNAAAKKKAAAKKNAAAKKEDARIVTGNDWFQAAFEALHQGAWQEVTDSPQGLFDSLPDGGGPPPPEPEVEAAAPAAAEPPPAPGVEETVAAAEPPPALAAVAAQGGEAAAPVAPAGTEKLVSRFVRPLVVSFGGATREVVGFKPTRPPVTENAPSPKAKYEFIPLSLAPNDRPLSADVDIAPFTKVSSALRRGFLRLKLLRSFLHERYASEIVKQAKLEGEFPNAPYTPVISSLTLEYQAETTVDYRKRSAEDFERREERLFQVGPFGQREIYPIAGKPTKSLPIDRRLVPVFDVRIKRDDGTFESAYAEGTLYIGIDRLVPPQNLTLLFRVAEGSEEPEAPTPPVTWSYWGDGAWRDFGATEVTAEGTNGLLRTGIVGLAMPKQMSSSPTMLSGKLHWVRASVPGNTSRTLADGSTQAAPGIPKLIAIHTQAAKASFRDNENSPLHLGTPLPAGTISKLKSREAAIKSVTQPYASFGGRMAEPDTAFYTRVSERLRHKQRAVTIFDYERIVLDRFPDVYKVRCLNHTRSGSEFAPGHVKLVVVPNLRNQNAVDPLRPRLSRNRLVEIRDWLQPFASDFARIDVANPVYEEIAVRFDVRFQPGRDKGLYTAVLEKDIIGFLSPWLHDDAADLVFGGQVHRSSILYFVEKRPYVDFVVDFEMRHAGDGRDVEQAIAKSSSSALVSAKQHEIRTDVKSCEDEERTRVTCMPKASEEADVEQPCLTASEGGTADSG